MRLLYMWFERVAGLLLGLTRFMCCRYCCFNGFWFWFWCGCCGGTFWCKFILWCVGLVVGDFALLIGRSVLVFCFGGLLVAKLCCFGIVYLVL